jgi:flagellar hook-associated protein 3 FlgL
MTLISLGDMAQTFALRRMTASMKQTARIAAQELTSGRSADTSQKVKGDLSRLTGIEGTLARLKGYRLSTDNAALTATAMQSVFAQFDRLTDGVGTGLLNASSLEGTRTLGALTRDAAQRLDVMLTALNTKVGDTTVFAGIATDGPAMASSDSILTALEAVVTAAGVTSAADIAATVTAWFEAPTGFAATAYTGGPPTATIAVSAEDNVDLAITAADPALRDTLKSLALVALVDRKNVVTDTKIGAEIAKIAGETMLQSHSDRAILAGRIGLAQARIDQAKTRNVAEEFTLQMARSDLLSVDPYEAATRMEAAQNQLETLYSVTARLSRQSLVDFLR